MATMDKPEIYTVETTTSKVSQSPTSPSRSKFKTAFEDTKHFAGGLISHPVESNKHFSILRHSHGLVMFRGSSTNVAITIFSDQPLPADRTLWLQRKGWSGKTGMRVGTLGGKKDGWVDVTPTQQVEADQLPQSDERAWQRDIKKFIEKAPKKIRDHLIRETDVIRVPCEADDGYLRVVLCAGAGKKVLCPSPVFRVISLSTSSSSIRGASLLTLPIELGVKALTNTVMTAGANVVAPVTSVIQNQVSQYMPNSIVQGVGTTLYDMSGAQDKIDNLNDQYEAARSAAYDPMTKDPSEDTDRLQIVGDLSGPEDPYPVRLFGKVGRGDGRTYVETGVPTARIRSIPHDIKSRLAGVYFGWVSITPVNFDKEKLIAWQEWKQAVVTAVPVSKPGVAPKTKINAYVIHNFQGEKFFDAKISIILMGFLRPWVPNDPEALLQETYGDITVTQLSLNRPEWGIETTLMREKTENRSLADRYVDARRFGQRQVDRIAVHKAGVRTNSARLKDKLVGNGGLFVLRQQKIGEDLAAGEELS